MSFWRHCEKSKIGINEELEQPTADSAFRLPKTSVMLRYVLDAKSKVAAAANAISFIDAHPGTRTYACDARDHTSPLILHEGRIVTLQPQFPSCTDDVLASIKRELSTIGDVDALSKLEAVKMRIHSSDNARLLSSPLPFTSALPSSVAPFADGQEVNAC